MVTTTSPPSAHLVAEHGVADETPVVYAPEIGDAIPRRLHAGQKAVVIAAPTVWRVEVDPQMQPTVRQHPRRLAPAASASIAGNLARHLRGLRARAPVHTGIRL